MPSGDHVKSRQPKARRYNYNIEAGEFTKGYSLSSLLWLQLPVASAQCLSTAAAQPEGASETGKGGKWGKYLLGGLAAATGGVGFAMMEDEAEHGLHAPAYPWSHSGWFSAYDHASIRRGHQVYQQVGSLYHAVLGVERHIL